MNSNNRSTRDFNMDAKKNLIKIPCRWNPKIENNNVSNNWLSLFIFLMSWLSRPEPNCIRNLRHPPQVSNCGRKNEISPVWKRILGDKKIYTLVPISKRDKARLNGVSHQCNLSLLQIIRKKISSDNFVTILHTSPRILT